MAMPLCKLEGTWQEISERVPDFDTRKLQVLVCDADEAQQDAPAAVAALQEFTAAPRLTLTEVLREIE